MWRAHLGFASGLYGAFADTAALREAERSGEAIHVDVPMLSATLGIAALQTSEFFGKGTDPLPLGSANPRNAPYQAFMAADDYFAMAARNDRLHEASVCDGRCAADLSLTHDLYPPWTAPPTKEFKDLTGERPARRVQLNGSLALTRWVCAVCAPINKYSEVLADEQVRHPELVQSIELPNGSQIQTVVSPTDQTEWTSWRDI